jgi:hypothetical protein
VALTRGDTYEKVNEAAEMRWHLERARIIASIESEMTAEQRSAFKTTYVNTVNDRRYLQVRGGEARLRCGRQGQVGVPAGGGAPAVLQVGQQFTWLTPLRDAFLS